MARNLCGKTVSADKAYEVWRTPDRQWTWYVLKKWQADDHKPYARWFCKVTSPFTPEGELGDTYAADVMGRAVKIIDRVPKPSS